MDFNFDKKDLTIMRIVQRKYIQRNKRKMKYIP